MERGVDREIVSVIKTPEQPRYPQGYVRSSSPSLLTEKGQLGGGDNDNGAPGAAEMLVCSCMVQVSREHALCGGCVGRGGAYPALDRLVTWISQFHHLHPWLGVLGAEVCPL